MAPDRRVVTTVATLLFGINSTDVALAAQAISESPFVVELPGLASSDLLDRRVAELAASSLAELGVRLVAVEEEVRIRESQADLEYLATSNRERAMEALRSRSGDFIVLLGSRGSLEEPELVYGLETHAAKFEVSATLIRTIDASISRASAGVAEVRRQSPEQATEAALAEAVARAMSPLVEWMRTAAMEATLGLDLVVVGGNAERDILLDALSSRVSGLRLIASAGAVIRVEPAPPASSLEATLLGLEWIVIDRALGVWLIESTQRSSPPRTALWWFSIAGILASGVGLLVFVRRRQVARLRTGAASRRGPTPTRRRSRR